MIDNDPNKCIGLIARDIYVRVSYQAGSAWRHSVFLIQDEKGLINITG